MIKMLFNIGPFSNLEIDSLQSVEQAKQCYDACVVQFGVPKEAPKKGGYGGGGGQRAPLIESGNTCSDCGSVKVWKADKSSDYCKALCWKKK